MKKVLFSMLVVLFAVTTVQAKGKVFSSDDKVFDKGATVLNLGVGLFSGYGGAGYSSLVPPITGSFDIGIVDNVFDENSSIGLGGFVSYFGQRFKVLDESFGYNYLTFGGRGTFHYQFVNKLDTYAGIALGYQILSTKHSMVGGVGGSGFYWSGFIGARYYFTPKLGGFAEFGNGISYSTLGIALKF